MKIKLLITVCALACCNAAYSQANNGAAYSWDNLPKVSSPIFKKDTLNILSFGAVGDGTTLNTKSINNAIDQCSKNGGGVVLVPGGLWLSGPIVLKDNVNLHISRSATLQFTGDFDQYRLVEGNYEGKPSMRNQSPISGTNLKNIAITGTGIIDGNGDYWRMVTKDRLTESEWKKKVASGGFVGEDGRTWYPSAKTLKGHKTPDPGAIVPGKKLKDYDDVKDFLRPNLLVLTSCKGVLLEGVTFQNSPAWCLHPLMCEDLTVRNVNVKNPEYAQNGDGIDIESCKNVLVEGSTFDVGDDGICIKSGKDEAGRKRGMPTENVIIRNNIVYKGHGGFVIGSEMSGGARNLFVYDCTFIGTDKGLRFKTTRGRGGVVENIFVKNIAMKDIVQEAIFFDMYYFTKPPVAGTKPEVPKVTEETPEFRNFYISNIVCAGAEKGLFVRGLPEMKVKNINISNAVLKSRLGPEIIEASSVHFKNVKFITGDKAQDIRIEHSSEIYADTVKLK
jgi:polygalacturonase